MSHHFLYHYNAYHIVIVKPSLPRFYLCNIQKISAQFARYLPKLPSTTAKAARSLVGAGAVWSGVGTLGSPSSRSPYRIPRMTKLSLPHLYLYHIQNFIERFSPYLAKLPSTTAKANAYLVGAGAVWSGVGTLGSPSSRSLTASRE